MISYGAIKKVYICPDNHTDHYWEADTTLYKVELPKMIDYYLNQLQFTKNNPPSEQTKYNCDGTIHLWYYEQTRTQAQFQQLIDKIKSGHISVMANTEITTFGPVPAEAVIRDLYYAGSLERKYGISFPMAMSQENQTLPLGLGSLWAGCGVKYSWKGVCACATQIKDITTHRPAPMYWWTGLDGSKILMKWYPILAGDNMRLGGYAEARDPNLSIDDCINLMQMPQYPYTISSAFGFGQDNVGSTNHTYPTVAKQRTNDTLKVISSNQIDFFQDFESTYGSTIPSISLSYGNEWDILSSTAAKVVGEMRQTIERMRTAEALGALAWLKNPNFMDSRREDAKIAFRDIGLFWQHSWTNDGHFSAAVRADWARAQKTNVSKYVNNLEKDALSAISGAIPKSGNVNYFVFNPLSYSRTDIVDIPVDPTGVTAIDLTTGQAVPSQAVTINGTKALRIVASDIPSLGYKIYEIKSGSPFAGQSSLSADASTGTLSSSRYSIKVAGDGSIRSLILKNDNNRELVRIRSNQGCNSLGSYTGTDALRIENSGPVSTTIVAQSNLPISHTTRITIYENLDRIDISNEITQNFINTREWMYSLNVESPDVWHEEVGAIIRAKKSTSGGHYSTTHARYDYLSLNHFVDMSGSDGRGITLSNTHCQFFRIGESSPQNFDSEQPYFRVLAGLDGTKLGLDNQVGDNYFLQKFSLNPHRSFSKLGAMRFALEATNPCVVSIVNGGTGLPAKTFSLLSINDTSTLLWTIKPPEKDAADNGLVVRLWNLAETNKTPSLSIVNGSIQSAKNISHIETVTGNATIQNNALVTQLNKQQIKSFAIKPSIPGVVDSKKFNSKPKEKVINYNLSQIGKHSYLRLKDIQQGAEISFITAQGKILAKYTLSGNSNIPVPQYNGMILCKLISNEKVVTFNLGLAK